MSVFSAGVVQAAKEVKENAEDFYTHDFGVGPVSVTVKDIVNKGYKYLEPPNSTIKNDPTIGAETVSMVAPSNPAFEQENFISMFDRLDGELFDGTINTGSKKRRIFAPFSTYTPSAIWPYQSEDGSRYTVHDLAQKDIGMPEWAVKPVTLILGRDLDIDEDGSPDYGGLPLFRWVADPLMGLGPIILTGILLYTAANVIPALAPTILMP